MTSILNHAVALKNYFLVYFRDAVSDLALHFLAKMKIMVVKDIDREDIEFVCKVRGIEQLCGHMY